MADKILKKFPFFGENRYILVLRFTDYESAIRFQKFTMVDPIWREKFRKKFDYWGKNLYIAVSMIIDYESAFRFKKITNVMEKILKKF